MIVFCILVLLEKRAFFPGRAVGGFEPAASYTEE